MKTKLLSLVALASMLFVSCGSETNKQQGEETATVATETYHADIAASKVNWRGEVAGIYGHHGYLNLQKGWVNLEGETVIAGEFTVDMSTIVPTDSASFSDEEGHRITDLQAHLSTADFFNTKEFTTSTFVISSSEGNTIKGNLTIRGKTNEETVEIRYIEVSEGTLAIKGELVFNRQNYDVAWKHYMKDMILSDNISLNISLFAKK